MQAGKAVTVIKSHLVLYSGLTTLGLVLVCIFFKNLIFVNLEFCTLNQLKISLYRPDELFGYNDLIYFPEGGVLIFCYVLLSGVRIRDYLLLLRNFLLKCHSVLFFSFIQYVEQLNYPIYISYIP